jgi:hypothetical protein
VTIAAGVHARLARAHTRRFRGATVVGLIVSGLLIATAHAHAADPDQPHPHQGLVPAFAGAPPQIELTPEQLRTLDDGEAVLTTLPGDAGGRGIAIQDIHATPEVIWGRIRDFRAYPRMVDRVDSCEPYFEEGDDVRVRFASTVLGFEYVYFIRHNFRPDEGYVTWTLDYSRESDLDDSVGYWAVIPHPEKPGWSRLFYGIDMRTRGYMPGFVRHFIAKRGLGEATAWVKREAEAEPEPEPEATEHLR